MASDPKTGTSSSRKPSLSDVGRSAARYLFAIAMLSGSGSDRGTTGELQEYLDVAPAIVEIGRQYTLDRTAAVRSMCR